jgi:hypothetical protein
MRCFLACGTTEPSRKHCQEPAPYLRVALMILRGGIAICAVVPNVAGARSPMVWLRLDRHCLPPQPAKDIPALQRWGSLRSCPLPTKSSMLRQLAQSCAATDRIRRARQFADGRGRTERKLATAPTRLGRPAVPAHHQRSLHVHCRFPARINFRDIGSLCLRIAKATAVRVNDSAHPSEISQQFSRPREPHNNLKEVHSESN